MSGRTLHVRCTTWEQVEVFYTRKLRKGKLLSMKVPFPADLGTPVTLSLELPNQIIIAIDGKVQKAAPVTGDAGKTWIEIELIGFTDEVIGRIKAMMMGAELPDDPTPPPLAASVLAAPAPVAVPVSAAAPVSAPVSMPAPVPVPVAVPLPGRAAPPPRRLTQPPPVPPPPPSGHELPNDERLLFNHLTGELRRLRQLAVHEVLDVDRDADADVIRVGWMKLVRRHHPDLVARHHAAAITHLAEELTILCNRAYDRLRAAMVLEGRATSVGSVLQQPAGWLVGFDDISSREASVARTLPTAADDLAVALPGAADPAPAGTPPPPLSVVQGGEAFETRARAMLSNGEALDAQEVLAAALCVYPRSRPLRSLYYVASALGALMKGEVMLATSQLETALAHHEQCVEAAQILEHLKRHGDAHQEELRRYFR